VILGFGASASADLPLCGYVMDLDCPGCQSYTPPGGCFCGPVQQACHCRKTTGGIQDGIKVECYTNKFDYHLDENGFEIIQGPDALCSRNFKCTMSGGGQLNCATYRAGTCPLTDESKQCNWRPWGNPNYQPTYAQGAACRS
jgi:hypothetical protein